MLTATDIRGIVTPLLTVFNEDESLDLERTRQHAVRCVDAGVHGVFPLGTNGEVYVLSLEEKLQVLEAVVDAVGQRVPVYAGTGTIGTKESIRTARQLEKAGADVLSVVSPFYAAASQEEIYRHFAAIAESVDIPIILYNIPARTGVSILPATVERLATVDGIIGVKDSSGNFDNILQYLEVTDRDAFTVLSGNDSLILWTLLAGGRGGIAGTSNIYPHTLASLYDCWAAGDLVTAHAVQRSIRRIRGCFRHGNPNTVVKAAVRFTGADVGQCRAPFNVLSPEALADIESTVTADLAVGLN